MVANQSSYDGCDCGVAKQPATVTIGCDRSDLGFLDRREGVDWVTLAVTGGGSGDTRL